MVTKNCSHEIPYHIMSCSMLITGTKFYPTLFKRRIREYFWDVARNWSGTLLPFFFFFWNWHSTTLVKELFLFFLLYFYIYIYYKTVCFSNKRTAKLFVLKLIIYNASLKKSFYICLKKIWIYTKKKKKLFRTHLYYCILVWQSLFVETWACQIILKLNY